MSYNSKGYSSWTPSKNIIGPPLFHVYDGTADGNSDDLATITASGYFNELVTYGRLRIGDVFFIQGTDGSQFAKVLTVSPDVTVDTNFNFTLAVNSVTTDTIQDGAVTTAKIDDLAVTTDKIADAAVTTDKVANNSITVAKIADNSVNSLKFAPYSEGSGDAGVLMQFVYSVGTTPRDIIVQRDLRVVDVVFLMRSTGAPGNTLKLRNTTASGDITEAVDVSSGVDFDVFRNNKLDPTYWELSAGDTLSIVPGGGTGNSNAFVFCVPI